MGTISETIQSIQTNLGNAYDTIGERGGTLPQNKNLANLATAIDNMPVNTDSIIPNIVCSITTPAVADNDKLWIQTATTPTNITITKGTTNYEKYGIEPVETYDYSDYEFNIYPGYAYVKNTTLNTASIFAIGGGYQGSRNIWEIDAETGDVVSTYIDILPHAGCYFACVSVDADIYIFGGTSSASVPTIGYLYSIYKFNTSTGVLTQCAATLEGPVVGVTPVFYDNKIYVFPANSSSYYIYDINQDLITVSGYTQNNYSPKYFNSTVLYLDDDTSDNDMVYFFGGVTSLNNISSPASGGYYTFKFHTEAINRVLHDEFAIYGAPTIITPSNRCYLIGGIGRIPDNAGERSLHTLIEFDFDTKNFTIIDDIIPGYADSALLTDNGDVLCIGLHQGFKFHFKDIAPSDLFVFYNSPNYLTHYRFKIIKNNFIEGYISPSGALTGDTDLYPVSLDWAIYDGVNWRQKNTEIIWGKLYSPTVSLSWSGFYVTITNNTNNQSYSGTISYDIYMNGNKVGTTQATSFSVEDYINAAGDFSFGVKAVSTGILDSNLSNTVSSKSYNLVTNLTNITTTYNKNYIVLSSSGQNNITLNATSGTALPWSVAGTVVGAYATKGGTWDLTSGYLSLRRDSSYVGDTVTITMSGVPIYTITSNLTNISGDSANPTQIGLGRTVELRFVANSGYRLPDSVIVTNATLESWTNGVCTISNPTGNVTVTIVGEQVSGGYTVTITNLNDEVLIYDGDVFVQSLNAGSADVYITSGTMLIYGGAGGYKFYGDPGTTGGVTLIAGGDEDTYCEFSVSGNGTVYDLDWHCLIEGTQITLADGSTKAIEDITYDDELLVWDFYEGKLSIAKPKWIMQEGTANKYNLVKFSNGTSVGFVGPGGKKGYHRIFNQQAGAFTHTGVDETPIGTFTYDQHGYFPEVVSQEIIKGEVKYYNIITDKHFNLFANGILTSCRLSNKYKIENMKYVGEELISAEDEEKYFKKIERSKKQ